MTARILCAPFFWLALSGAGAQTTPPDAPDQVAWTTATKITDPEKKIAALEKFKKDFPGSSYASAASSQVFSTLIQKMPQQRDRIRKAAKTMFAEAVAKDKTASRENRFATTANRGRAASRIAPFSFVRAPDFSDSSPWKSA